MQYDSTGNLIFIGDRVLFRGKEFTVKGFALGQGRHNTAAILFNEPIDHTPDVPDEISVDKLEFEHDRKSCAKRNTKNPMLS